jgi:uncharacterized membrane protein
MARVEKAIEVERPVAVVYEQWIRFEEFPHFFEDVTRVEDLGDGRLRWTEDGDTWEVKVQWEPGESVTWEGVEPGRDAWRASLIALSPKRTRVDLRWDHDPHGLIERAADVFGALERRVGDDLLRFKTHVETHTDPPE